MTCTEKLQQCYHCISQEAAIDILRAEFGDRLRHSVATVSLLPTIPRVRACAQRSSQVSAEVGDRVLELRISHSRQDAANVNPIMTKRVSFLQVILMNLRGILSIYPTLVHLKWKIL